MPLSDLEAEERINQMIAFINLEAQDQIDKINAHIEELYNYEKAKIIQQQRLIIQQFYDKKEKQLNSQKKLEQVHSFNDARLNILKYRDDRFHDVLKEVQHHLDNMVKNPSVYRKLLKDLILQGLFLMVENVIILKIRRSDRKLIKSIYSDICKIYYEQTNKNVNIKYDEQYLNVGCTGGVIVYSTNKKIIINNTLDERFKLIIMKFMPEIRTKLFGPNPHRTFFK